MSDEDHGTHDTDTSPSFRERVEEIRSQRKGADLTKSATGPGLRMDLGGQITDPDRCDECGQLFGHEVGCSNRLIRNTTRTDPFVPQQQLPKQTSSTASTTCDCEDPKYSVTRFEDGDLRVRVLLCDRCEMILDTVGFFEPGGDA